MISINFDYIDAEKAINKKPPTNIRICATGRVSGLNELNQNTKEFEKWKRTF